MRNPLYVFNPDDELLAITSDYEEAIYDESLDNEGVTFNIIFPINHENSEHFIGGNQVAFKDLKGNFRLFIIREVDDEDGDISEKVIQCLPAMDELEEFIIEDKRPTDDSLLDAVTTALEGTRWQAGYIAELGINSTTFYYISSRSALLKIKEVWGGEIVDRISVGETGITGRYIDFVERRGADTGKRFEIDKDIKKITRTAMFYPKTALYGRGAGVEVGDGYGRKITFEDVEWIGPEDGGTDPVTKPLGQKWIGNPDSLEKYGIRRSDGTKQHRFGQVDFSEEKNIDVLLQKTWEVLLTQNEPKVRYKMSVVTFRGIAGYEHEEVLLGDTGAIIHNGMKPPILLEARIIRFKYDIGDPSNGDVVLGNFLDLNEYEKKVEWAIEKVENRSAIWDTPEKVEITNEEFPDTTPPIPTGVNAVGLFRSIKINWNYIYDVYIAAYEVYASQVPGFVPDSSNLVFRGRTGGLLFEADTGQQWYFKLRTINTHGTPSDFTDEITANTVVINAEREIEPLTITNELIAEGVSADKITTGILEAIELLGVTIKGSTFESTSGHFILDDQGIVVNLIDENGNVLGYTNITSTGFAGYYDTNDDGTFEKVFYLQDDETVSKKFRAKEEFTMGTIKIVEIDNVNNKGWAFVPTEKIID